MSKDERIWIPDNYYQGFLRGCLANELIEETPSKTALENAGCEISALCYLILPNGSQHNPRLMNPNEFPTSIRQLFEASSNEAPIEPNTVDEAPSQDHVDETQECDTCKEVKTLQSFKRYPGRLPKYRPTCIECQSKEGNIPNTKHDDHPIPETSEEHVSDAVIIQTRPTSVTVTLDYLKRLATEAYMRGREYERSNTTTVEPSLDELLEIGA